MPGFWAFVRAIFPELIALARKLYAASGGDVVRAKETLRKIPDAWSGEEEFRAAVDQELRDMKAREGK